MEFKTRDNDRIVLAGGVRTPIGQAGKSYADIPSYELGYLVTEEIFKRTGVPKSVVSGVVAGEIGQSCFAPNVARVISVRANLPLEATAITVQNNCVSGFEAVFDAARRILIGEGDFYLALGMESMSQGALIVTGAKQSPKTSTAEKINANWAEVQALGLKVVDSIDEGLNDPIRQLNMAMTGEVVAQNSQLKKKDLDNYAFNSYRKALEAIQAGKYRPYQVAVDTPDGKLEDDEFIMSKTGMVENPARFEKAGAIFDSKYMSIKEFYDKYGEWIKHPYKEGETEAAVTLFNACPRSDGAGAIFVTTEKKAKELGLPVQAVLSGWGMHGVDPAVMGIGMAGALNQAVKNTGSKFEEVDYFEIHEAFAATAMGTMKEVKESYGFDLVKANEDGKVNPHGGTLALGHPLGATGIRVLLNMIMNFDNFKDAKKQIGVICAGGGVAGSAILERP
ncbi:thiolase family protein [Leptospira sp. GIMC2001]|uniref:thiolase family protein n=1 Tax=Leptospira sp. GIMC2001 TaxID=1513297 RepID=UPI00234B2785|nr:thiolase family protein [Leptospira sp. GIMC2001]WCL47900.1 thiolase family protein [Leptospira sp. GIMC2001]